MKPIALYGPGGRIAVWGTVERLIVDVDDRCVWQDCPPNSGRIRLDESMLDFRERLGRYALEQVTPDRLQGLIGGDHRVLVDALFDLPAIPKGPDSPDERLHLALARRLAGVAWIERDDYFAHLGNPMALLLTPRWPRQPIQVSHRSLEAYDRGDVRILDSLEREARNQLRGGEEAFCSGSATPLLGVSCG